MKRSFDMPDTLRKLEINSEDVKALKDEMIKNALADTCTATNPRKASYDDILQILSKVTPF